MPSLFERLKVPVLTIFISLLIFFVMVKVFGPIPFAVNSVTTQKTDLFTVDGVGEATGVPDTAQVSIGVNKSASTVELAQNEVNKTVNAITEELKKLGVAEKDIKTTNYNVNPNIDYSSGKQATTGYNVDVTMNINLNDSKKANQVIDTATKNGANVISGVSFVLNDEAKMKLEDEARAEAIKNAKAKAKTIASQAGIRLGRIISVNANPTTPGPIMYDKAATNLSVQAEGAPTQLQPGENKISITVYLSYETL